VKRYFENVILILQIAVLKLYLYIHRGMSQDNYPNKDLESKVVVAEVSVVDNA